MGFLDDKETSFFKPYPTPLGVAGFPSSESLKNQPVISIPGIGPKTSKELIRFGFESADTLLGQLLVVKKDRYFFIMWLRLTIGSTAIYPNCLITYTALRDWCNHHL